MIRFDEALDLVQSRRFLGGSEEVDLDAALGRVLAADIVAPFPVPRFDSSAMDGYAVGCAFGPWKITHEIAAGAQKSELVPGEAARVLTGAPVPTHAFAVIAQEQAQIDGNILRAACASGDHIRREGQELSLGQVVVESGAVIRPAEIAAIASMGCARVPVRSRPRVLVVSMGDELAAVGSELGPSQVFDSNSPAMTAALRCFDAEIETVRVKDSLDALVGAIHDRADLILTIAGVSVGDYDFVRPAMQRLGFTTEFAGVAMKPGKPVTFGVRGHQRWLALPGNPMSALTTFALFGAAWLGGGLQPRCLPLTSSFTRKPGREEFVPCRWRNEGLEVLPIVGSHSVSGLVGADVLARLPAETARFEEGEKVWAYLLPWTLR